VPPQNQKAQRHSVSTFLNLPKSPLIMAPTAFCRISLSSDRQPSSYIITLHQYLHPRVSFGKKGSHELMQVSQCIATTNFEDVYIFLWNSVQVIASATVQKAATTMVQSSVYPLAYLNSINSSPSGEF
jgi:hypothetical protein